MGSFVLHALATWDLWIFFLISPWLHVGVGWLQDPVVSQVLEADPDKPYPWLHSKCTVVSTGYPPSGNGDPVHFTRPSVKSKAGQDTAVRTFDCQSLCKSDISLKLNEAHYDT